MRVALILLPIITVCTLLMASDMAALSQTKLKEKTPAPAPAAQVPLKGTATTEAAAAADNQPPSSGWVSRCTSDGRQSTLDCSVEQSIIETKSRQLLMQVLVRVPPDTHKPVLTIQMPLGLFLPGGVMLKLDDGKSDRLDVQTCDQKGCYIQMPVSNDMLQAMGKGKQMTVSFQNLSKQDINIPVPLNGFMVAYQKVQ